MITFLLQDVFLSRFDMDMTSSPKMNSGPLHGRDRGRLTGIWVSIVAIVRTSFAEFVANVPPIEHARKDNGVNSLNCLGLFDTSAHVD